MPAPSKDFEFIYGSWNIHNRKLKDTTDPSCDEWIEFPATAEVRSVLGGFGHVDEMSAPEAPVPFEGFTLRLFDPAEEVWRIWWSSSTAPGALDVPVEGKFVDRHGVFECTDVIGGRPARVRFEWVADLQRPVWRQSFSFDEGETFTLNWVMEFTRL